MNLIPYLSNRINRNPANELADLLGWAHPASDSFRFHEDKDNYYVALDLPGVRKEDLQIEAEGERLTLTAERKTGFGEQKEVATIRRGLTLPESIATDKIVAVLVDGVLTLTLPKREEAKPKHVKVSVS
ncbi:HSP20 family protein [Verrucomicrobium sp. GAS474]|uniref:Hsp20/alpha crystallin family protein n=1 Tax=Verrucomicrobium sp. GAS474 TaxID=1882831 RepID=UPI00087D0391|nr:Hsp20/alpha crystallin family protein [Verrucomicrobium sp. GAS474]SDU10858.1 HSP20 family protein [Verrucomicrobium sp. GAS474]